jgi:hypothetical protein
MHDLNLIKKRLKKYQRKRQIREYKKKLKALRYWQIDIKDLRDIPNIYPLISAGIFPRYQYSARDVDTGTSFFCFAFEISQINSIRFTQAIFEHLKENKISTSEVVFQTDSGSEFIGSVFKKGLSGFTELVEKVYKAKHKTIPPRKKEYNGSVESFHSQLSKKNAKFQIQK